MQLKNTLSVFAAATLLVFGLASVSNAAEAKKPKIFITADIEGVGHVIGRESMAPGSYEFDRARHLMTAEVNAAIEGCLEAGAGEITVTDSHGNCLNLIPEELNEAAFLIRGTPKPLDMMDGIDETFAGVIMIGYHAKAGTPMANIAATQALSIFDMKINGQSISETYLNAAIAGDFGVPTIMITGDQNVVKEAREILGNVETVATKESRGFISAGSPHPNVIHRQIKEKARTAVERMKNREFKPLHVAGPIKMTIVYKNAYDAEHTSYLPGYRRIDGNTILIELKDMKEVAALILGLGII